MLTKIKIKEYLFGTIATRNLTGAFSLQTGVTPTPAIVIRRPAFSDSLEKK